MDVWNREELYTEIWEQPLVRVAAKYGISDVMLGKVCRKLSDSFAIGGTEPGVLAAPPTSTKGTLLPRRSVCHGR